MRDALTEQPSPPARSIPTGWRRVALVGSLTIFGPLCIDMYLPGLPEISRELHASASAVQLTLTACLIGLAVGQLILGPLSDRVGRRPPLLLGLWAFVFSSVACAFAPNIYALASFRLIQGLGGAAGVVIARSIVRDLHSGVELARFFSTLMLATGLGPVIAPQIGSWVLTVTTWRGVFIVLAATGCVLLVSAWRHVPETLAPEMRSAGSFWSTLAVMGSVARDRVFAGYALACGLGISALFAYIAGSSFALQNVYGLSPQVYGLVFALNAAGLVIGSQVNGRLVSRVPSLRLLTCGLTLIACAGGAIVVFVVTGAVGLLGVVPALFLVMFGAGFVGPNAVALALERYPQSAGAASALLGSLQFGLAAVIAPLAGVGGTHDALPMALLILALPAAALAIRAQLVARPVRPPVVASS